MSNFEVCNFMAFDICLFLEPQCWTELSKTHRCLQEQLKFNHMQQLFETQQYRRLEMVPRTGVSELACSVAVADEQDETTSSLSPVLNMSLTLEATTKVIADCVAHPHLLQRSLLPVQEALIKLQDLFQTESQLRPRIREAGAPARPLPIAKKLARGLASFSGLLLHLTDLLKVFSVERLPHELFIAICDVLVSLIQFSKDKKAFVRAGGLDEVLLFLQAFPRDAEVHSSGVGALIALSAKSEFCIRLMVSKGCLDIVNKSLQQFPSNTRVITRCVGLLGNMSNLPPVCPLLQECGIMGHVHAVLPEVKDTPAKKTLLTFSRLLFANLERCGSI